MACHPEILHAVAEQRGLVVLVVGAGCSLDAPTGLKLSRAYAVEANRQLELDGVLDPGECPDPDDLSAVATSVHSKTGSQAALVDRLPRSAFRTARANDGYLVAAALLREGAVGCVMTLNFDLAMSHALTELSADDVAVIAGPEDLRDLGSATLIYLHRNVEQFDPEKWILRREALEEEWRDKWEEVVAQRVMTTPVTVFAGLGSPAAVLTETVTRIRAAVADVLATYVVDPAETTAFQVALDLPDEAHIRLGWCEFMELLGGRVMAEHCASIQEACETLCVDNGWAGEAEFVEALCRRLGELGLVLVGKLRAQWLLDDQGYAPHDARTPLLADLMLAIGLVERGLEATMHFREDGVVEFRHDGRIVATVLLASGGGTQRWTAMEVRLASVVTTIRPDFRPTHAIIGGALGIRPQDAVPPFDVIAGDDDGDIIAGPQLAMLAIDELRATPEILSELVT
jgi:hypothetical protein